MKLRILLCLIIISFTGTMTATASAQDAGTKVDKATFIELKATLGSYANAVGHDGAAAVALLTDDAVLNSFGSPDRNVAAQTMSQAFPVAIYSAYNGRVYADGRYSIDFTSTGMFTPYGLQTRRWYLVRAETGEFLIDWGGDLLPLKLPQKLHQVSMNATFQLDRVTVTPQSVTYAEGDVVTIAVENTQPEGIYGLAVFRGDELINRLGLDPSTKDLMGLVNLTPGSYSVYLTQWPESGPANVMRDIATSFTVQ